MELEHQRKVTDLAGQAFDITRDQRKAWLRNACDGDGRLMEDVAALLGLMESGASLTQLDTLKPTAGTVNIDMHVWLGKTIGPYRVLEKLGEGGMGWVFLAQQTEPIERRVALKIVKPVARNPGKNAKLQAVFPPLMDVTHEKTAAPFPDGSTSTEAAVSERIQAEPQVLAMFTHPYIAQVYEAGTTPEGLAYFAMEYVPGKPLVDYCRSAAFGLEERLFLFMKVCRGVQHAHHNGVLHLDLKPSNILVSDIDGTASPKVIDFGIAMTTDPNGESRLQQNLAMGTPVYMCPEALSGKEVTLDARADVYALGVILFELLTGTPAYRSLDRNKRALTQKLSSDTLTRPSDKLRQRERAELAQQSGLSPRQLMRKLQHDLDWIVLKATAKNREDRYNSPAEVAGDLKRFFSGQPVEAAPPSAFYVARKFVSRYRPVTVGAAMFLTVMIAGLWFLWTSFHRADHALEVSRRTSEFMTAVIDNTSWRPEDLGLEAFLDNAERMLDQQLAEPSPSRAYYLMLLADVYTRSGRHERAVPLIRESFAILERESFDHPGLVPLLLIRGRIFLEEGRFEAAEADIKRAIAISEDRVGARKMDRPLYFLARVYEAQGRFNEMEEVCRRALSIIGERRHTREKPRILRLLAKSLEKQGRMEEALEYHLRSLDPPPLNQLGPPPFRQ